MPQTVESRPQTCGFCDGRGVTWKKDRAASDQDESRACPACFGRGCVLVRQPAQVCPDCNGWGRIGRGLDTTGGEFQPCEECGGMGWQDAMPLV
ncbi:MAG: hypothetical protein EXR60_03445 [Dehalococcoidia bacterium]|nr:hypothetical protein [Dehalococcoidia bacterium]